MADPKIMCRNHLLGEHAEIHMFIGAINRRQSMNGYLKKGFLEVHNLCGRHEELVKEMKRRGYEHCSVLEENWISAQESGCIDRQRSLRELVRRCSRCRQNYAHARNRSP